MKKTIALLLCVLLTAFAPLNAFANMGMGDRAAIFDPDLEGAYGLVRMDDGTLRDVGEGPLAGTEGWTGLKSIMFNGHCVIGLTEEGKVLLSDTGGLVKSYRMTDALKWKDIVSLEWNWIYLYGIDAQGTLHVTGGDDSNRRLVAHHKADGWKNIKQAAANMDGVFALQTDGTVRLFEPNTDRYGAAEGWTDIVQIAVTDHTLFGLRADGTVVQCGRYEYSAAAGWTGVKELCADGLPAVGAIMQDGTVAGDDSYRAIEGAESWTGVRKLIADTSWLYAIGPDGGLLTTRAMEISGEWHDLVDIWLDGSSIAGLRADGTVLYKNKPYETRIRQE